MIRKFAIIAGVIPLALEDLGSRIWAAMYLGPHSSYPTIYLCLLPLAARAAGGGWPGAGVRIDTCQEQTVTINTI